MGKATNLLLYQCPVLALLCFAQMLTSSEVDGMQTKPLSSIHARNDRVIKGQSQKSATTAALLNAKELRDLNVASIAVQLKEDDPFQTFDGLLVDAESWFGVAREGNALANFVLPKDSGFLAGVIHSDDRDYSVSTQNDGSVLAQVVQDHRHRRHTHRRLAQYSGSNFEEDVIKNVLARRDIEKKLGRNRMLQLGGLSRHFHKKATVIDVMMLFTPNAVCAHDASLPYDCDPDYKPHRAAIEAEAILNIHLTNVALQLSGANVEFNIVHMAVDDYKYGTSQDSVGSLINLLKDHNKNIHKLRERHRADVVVLMTDDDFHPSGGNGRASITFDNGNNQHTQNYCDNSSPLERVINISPEEREAVDHQFEGYCPQNAYVVVNRNGKNNLVMTHELGHILDLEDSDKSSYCQTDDSQPGGCFKTLMRTQKDWKCTCCSGPTSGNTQKCDQNTTLVAETEYVHRILFFAPDQIPFIENAAPYVSRFGERHHHGPLVLGLAGFSLLACGVMRVYLKRTHDVSTEQVIDRGTMSTEGGGSTECPYAVGGCL